MPQILLEKNLKTHTIQIMCHQSSRTKKKCFSSKSYTDLSERMSSTSSHTDTDADFDTGVDNVENDAELCTKSSQTEVTLEKLQQEIFSLKKEKEGIQKELSTARVELLELKNDVVQPLENASSTKFSYNTVVAENMLNFYTEITTPGLFEWFLSFFVRKVRYFSEKLSHNDHLLLVLMKLKLGLLNKDLYLIVLA
ncbi:uncharacterized protein LOC130642098 [Hydractinia symbiolongicarpus]|uniref:uncharacterized protein LOC130642098 n=1 Tax=Hydractinia symbiolongicarpus TaxID=13093 RepID=UPI00254A81D3|nr:uncharacterized protein LOC130642098 [Hydractinia symbiolongicarpus]